MKPLLGAIYIGRVSKYGARTVEKNGRKVLEFDLHMPGQEFNEHGYNKMFCVRVSAWGPDAETIDIEIKKGMIVEAFGKPTNSGRANALMCFTKDIKIRRDK